MEKHIQHFFLHTLPRTFIRQKYSSIFFRTFHWHKIAFERENKLIVVVYIFFIPILFVCCYFFGWMNVYLTTIDLKCIRTCHHFAQITHSFIDELPSSHIQSINSRCMMSNLWFIGMKIVIIHRIRNAENIWASAIAGICGRVYVCSIFVFAPASVLCGLHFMNVCDMQQMYWESVHIYSILCLCFHDFDYWNFVCVIYIQ